MEKLVAVIIIAVGWLALIAMVATNFRNKKKDDEMFRLMRRSYPEMNDEEAKLFWENEQIRIKEELKQMGKKIKG